MLVLAVLEMANSWLQSSEQQQQYNFSKLLEESEQHRYEENIRSLIFPHGSLSDTYNEADLKCKVMQVRSSWLPMMETNMFASSGFKVP